MKPETAVLEIMQEIPELSLRPGALVTVGEVQMWDPTTGPVLRVLSPSAASKGLRIFPGKARPKKSWTPFSSPRKGSSPKETPPKEKK